MLRKKRWMKVTVIALALFMVLPLVGCNEEAAPLKEGYIKSLEIESCRSSSTMYVTNNVPKDQLSQEALAVFSFLEKGLFMHVDMAGLQSMEITLTPGDDDLLRLSEIWTYPEDPALQFIMDGGRFAMKTSADPAFLVMDPAEAFLFDPAAEVDFASLFGDDYTTEQVKRVMEFFTPFMQDFDYSLSRVEQLGTVELELPDGTIEAQGIKVHLDLEEVLALLVYSMEYLAESKAFKDYLEFSMRDNFDRMVESGLVPPDELPTEEEIEEMTEMAYGEFQKVILQGVEYLEQVSPDSLYEEFGLEFDATEEYYLDGDGYIRKTRSVYHIKAEHEMLAELLGTPVLDITVKSEQMVWDINQPVEVNFPPEEKRVSFFALMSDPEQVMEMEDGPMKSLSTLIAGFAAYAYMGPPEITEEEITVRQFLMIDLETGDIMKNGEPMEMDVEPYLENQTLMVPFRDLAELAGGTIMWLADTREVHFFGDNLEMKFAAGSTQALVNGLPVDLEEPVVLKNGRAMVPLELASMLALNVFVEGNMAFFGF